jgi:hypothetical protein
VNLSPNTLTAIAISLLSVIYLWRHDDPRAAEWLKAQWSKSVRVLLVKRPKGTRP